MDLVDRDLGMELEDGFLDRCEADPAGRVRRDEDEAVACGQGRPCQTSASPRSSVGRPLLKVGWEREQTGLADR